MKRLIPIIVLVFLLAVAGGVVFGFMHGKQKREAEMTEFALCDTRFKEGQYQNAAQLLDTFLNKHPKSEKAAEAYYYLAVSREKLDDSAGAVPAWSKLIEKYPLSPNVAEAYYYIGLDYQKQGQYDKAMENYGTVVSKFANMPVAAGAWYGMGNIHELKGDQPSAITAYQNVIDNHPGTEFVTDAEQKLGDMKLEAFLKENSTMYEVGRGDSLVLIAAKFRIAPEVIKRLNGLDTNLLQSGQALKVIKPDFNILVDLSSCKLSLMSGDQLIKRYGVSIGKAETPTPTGNFAVTDKLIDPIWYSTTPSGVKLAIPPGDPRNELGPRWIGFKPAYGIHGTIAPDSIGKAMSHGCIRMHNEQVKELYDLIAPGTPVRIVAGAVQ